MAKIQTTNPIEQGKIVKQRALDGLKTVNPLQTNNSILNLCEIGFKAKRFMLSKSIEEPSYTVFMMIVSKWLLERKGMTINEVSAILCPHAPNSQYTNTQLKFGVLFARHMIEIVGKGGLHHKSNIYIPSSSSLSELGELIAA